MNKILHLILSIVLLLPVFLTEWPAGSMRAQAAELSEQGDRSALSVLSFETKINESTDEVETVLILENTGWQTVSLFWKLPRISAGIRKGTLSLSSSGNVLRTSEDEVFLTFAARESIVLSYRYCAKNPLVHARVIAMDLRDLVFREDGRIGRFFVSTELREEDLFLVKEVFPVNYTLEETTVSVELWNVKPSALLNRFYLSKETYRDLRGGREHEPNEEQLFVLDHYRDWLRDGLGLPENQSFQSNTVLFQTLMHPEQTLPSGGKLDAQYNRLREGTDAYLQLLHCICLREGRDLFGAPLWPLALEMERQKRFPEECHVIAIAYTSNPAVRDSLYYHPSDETEVLLKEEAVLTTEPKGFYSIKCSPNACAPYRIAEIGLGQTYDAETLQDYLDAIGAELFVKQMILDGRPLSPADYEKTALSGTNYAAVSSGNITAQDLIPLFSELSQVPSYMTLTVEDPLLSALDVPAFTHYLAVLTGDGLWFALHAGCYGTMFGAPFYAVVAASDAGQALLQPTLARRQATQNALRQRISAVPTAGLTETPFLENGDIGTLRVLELCLNIREETSVIRSEFRVKNDGPADILACLPLPVLRNRIAADSFSVTDADLGTPIAGGRIYGTIPAGGTLSVSYVYSTATPLLHSGAVGLDFAPLVFSPGGRIGHFSVSMELVPESIPLVTEISPVCYAFDGTTVSLDLWDFRPSALLNRFYLTKETYRGLRGSREYDPNEVERYVLENVRKWFRNGLPEIRDLDLPGTRDWAKLLVSEGFTSAYLLAEHSDTLAGVVTHLILTEKLRRGDLTPEAAALALREYDRIRFTPLLTREMLKKILCPEGPVVVAVEYAKTPSLQGVQLYSAHIDSTSDGEVETLVPVSELGILKAQPGPTMIAYPPESENIRLATFTDSGQFTAEELNEYLDAIGASLLVKSALLDDRDGALQAYRYEDPDTGIYDYRMAAYSALPDGKITADDLSRLFGAENVLILTREDASLSSVRIPALTMYYGAVIDQDGLAKVVDYWGGSVSGGPWENALNRVDEILAPKTQE